jgi:flagellar secretion chaperone FliS
MSMSAYQAASKSYAALDLETSINSASPHKLILMLYEGAITSLYRARVCMEEKKIQEKGNEISRAISIINEGLASCLNEEQGGDIAKNLANLYEYMSNRLMQANIENKVEWVDEIIKLLGDLRGAWEEIGHTAGAQEALQEQANSAVEGLPASVNPVISADATASSVSYGKV